MSNPSHLARVLFPPLTAKFFKGQYGRISVVGGSPEYTGAPFFGAMAALRMGTDLVHVLCPPEAAGIIKSYSPDLMVHPVRMDNTKPISDLLERSHLVLLGPGLGRSEDSFSLARFVIAEVRKRDIPIVVDADGLFLLHQEPELIRAYTKAILTPNGMELKRLLQTCGLADKYSERNADAVKALAHSLGGLVVLSKGDTDLISNGSKSAAVEETGSLRRVGGQGDVLSGIVSAYAAWVHLGIAGAEKSESRAEFDFVDACAAACSLSRRIAKQVFADKGRSMLASDLLAHVGEGALSRDE
jgi:ATP-dependent NAD(P)H-hydrate dehydratase